MKQVYQYCNKCRKETSQILTDINGTNNGYTCLDGKHKGSYRIEKTEITENVISLNRLG